MAAPASDALASALSNREFDQIAHVLDNLELESMNPAVLLEWPHALHLLGHMHNHSLEDARMLYKRIPSEAKADNAELDAAFRLLQYFWCRNYPGIWSALEGFQWTPQVRPLVDALVEQTRGEVLDLLSHAYSELSPSKAAALLGVSEAEALSVAQAAGWEQDGGAAAGGVPMLITKRKAAAADELGDATLQSLAEYMMHLEST